MKVPKGQLLWATYYDSMGKEKWAITSDATRMKYYLYALSKDGQTKVKTGKSPMEFEKEVGKI